MEPSQKKHRVCDAKGNPWPQHLIDEWHEDNVLKMTEVSQGSHKKVKWQCMEKHCHEWESTIAHRTNGRGCSVCAGKSVCPTNQCNSLEVLRPDLKASWHQKNEKSMREYTVSSNKRVWWKCDKVECHEWETTINHRTNGQGCPICAGRSICQTDQCNSLEVLRPDLKSSWHPTKNTKSMREYTISSNQKVWWTCDKVKCHEWESMINNRTNGNGCPVCAGKYVCPTDQCNSLEVLRPDLKSSWHPTKNKKSMMEYTVSSNQYAWWICNAVKCHPDWESIINDRTKGSGCSICAGQSVCPTNQCNSLEVLRPDLKSSWHPTKNKRSMREYTVGSDEKIWWKCDKVDCHEWETSIYHRTNGQGCPMCKKKTEGKYLEWLQNVFGNANIVYQATYKWLGQRKFDFLLSQWNLLSETDGIQHFENIAYFGNLKAVDVQEKDFVKMKLAIEHGLSMYRLPCDVIRNDNMWDWRTYIRRCIQTQRWRQQNNMRPACYFPKADEELYQNYIDAMQKLDADVILVEV